MKGKISTVNYEKLFFLKVKRKYFQMILGMLISYLLVSFSVRLIPKNFHVNISLPEFSSKPVAKKPTPKPIPAKTYIIQEGDDLWHIAEKFYGSGFNAYDISIANKISDPSILETGQKIIIPSVAPRSLTVGEISAASTSQVTYVEGKYIVQPGDSLSSIAGKVYGDIYAWPRLLQANPMFNPNRIEVGMVLTIPR
ncbi:LysM peptidoglycan-binding domain-containing protein [Patescibacteria group bacterium]|nr:LysM peptidoglycan-binding domain-containing protein [Patescibacteria group bacterium]